MKHRHHKMNLRRSHVIHGCWLAIWLASAGAAAARGGTIRVNSADDSTAPPAGVVTLRSALAALKPGGRIEFDPSLDGGTIWLTLVADEHTMLLGETYANGKFAGFEQRDYGRSALVARKDVVMNASALPHGITIAWGGGSTNHARVLAVLGNLTMTKVAIRSGHVVAEMTGDAAQPYTLARGGGVAVWGTASLSLCTLSDNQVEGDLVPARDRGAFGGGIYGNRMILADCLITGNGATGFGGAGGGVYSVGGYGMLGDSGSSLNRCTVSGNRVVGEHAYGGGVFSEGGGAGNSQTLKLFNCTVARNTVADNPAVAESPMAQYYYRGGGVYMSNGSLTVASCTIVENMVSGISAVWNGKPNMGGAGVAATIGNAHVVEQMDVWHSIIAGNLVNGAPGDVYSGSLVDFFSYGYNRIGKLDLSQMLAPVPTWFNLSRKHWPKVGDQDGVALADVVDLSGVVALPGDGGAASVCWYPPAGSALDQIPLKSYAVKSVLAEYRVKSGATDHALNAVLAALRTQHAAELGSDFGSGFADMTGTLFVATPNTWPADPLNRPWITFWRNLDAELAGRLGTGGLNDDFWWAFKPDSNISGVNYRLHTTSHRTRLERTDALGHIRSRKHGDIGDIGAIELDR